MSDKTEPELDLGAFLSEELPDWSDAERHAKDTGRRLASLSKIPRDQVLEVFGRRCLGSLYDHPIVQDAIRGLWAPTLDPYEVIEHISKLLLPKLSEYVMEEAGPGARILDFGSGAGSLRNFQKDYEDYPDNEFVAIDIATPARVFPPKVEFVQSDLHDFEHAGRPFDLAYAIHLFEHTPDPVRLMAKLRSLLRTGGRALVAVPDGRGLHDIVQHRYSGSACDHINAFTREAITGFMEEAGFALRAYTGWLAHYTIMYGNIELPNGTNLGLLLETIARDLDRIHGDTRLHYYGWFFLFEAM